MDTSVNFSSLPNYPSYDVFRCRISLLSGFLFTSWLTTYILFLPVFVYVLYIGYKRWRNHRPISTSHSDVFTFHMVAMEIIAVMGSCLYCWSMFAGARLEVKVGAGMVSMTTCGQVCFHILTCVERYLAVVHPITYRGLKQVGGVRIRNVSIGCVWLFSFVWMCLKSVLLMNEGFQLSSGLFWAVISLVFICFCSFSVICVLIRPGPGEVGGDRRGCDQIKRRAFYTVMAIMGALVMRFLVLLVIYILFSVSMLSVSSSCVTKVAAQWFNLPSSLVLPLLFLQRAGKLKLKRTFFWS